VASQIDVEDDAKDVKAGLSFQEIIANICKSPLFRRAMVADR